MQNNPGAFQDAVNRAKQIAQKLSAAAPGGGGGGGGGLGGGGGGSNPMESLVSSMKRSNNDDDYSNKRPAYSSQNSADIPPPVLRAQQVAQQINSQLGVNAPGRTTGNELALLPLSNQFTLQEDYKIPDKLVGLVIGKGGEQITRIQFESGCKVQISPARPDPNPGPNPPDRLANLSGSKEAIERAKRMIDDIVSKGKPSEGGGGMGMNPYSLGGSNVKSIELMLPSAKCGLIIGKGGENIKRVSEEFGVKMHVIQESIDMDGIEHKPLKIMGEPDRVERARQYVLDTLAKRDGAAPMGGGPPNRFGANPNNNTFNDYGTRNAGGAYQSPMNGQCNEATYHVPADKAGIVIGKGGESIKEINRRSGAFVEIDKNHQPGNAGDRLFKLRGTPEQIAAAQQLMYDKVVHSPGGPGDMLPPVQFQQQFNLPQLGNNTAEPWNGTNDQYGNGANGAANANDPYSQWTNAYGQWPQVNPYDTPGYGDGSTKNSNNSTSATSAAGAAGVPAMDPAWLAYYQQMNFYGMMQSGMTAGTSTPAATSTTTTKATDSTATTASNNSTSTTAAAGQPDYSQQWIEYYRSIGQNEFADEIVRQMKESGSSATAVNNTTGSSATPSSGGTSTGNSSSTSSNSLSAQTAAAQAAAAAMMMSAGNPWAAYAQQYQQWGAAATGSTSTGATTNGSGSSTAQNS